jgi:ribosome biogenesis GTPase
MPEGRIVKLRGGYYDVLPLDGSGEPHPIRCRARGVFKKRGITPLVGDRVVYTPTANGEGTVDDIFPRSTELIRPPVANVEQAVLVFSVAEPELGLQLLDKLIVHTEHAGLDTVICLTKIDLLDAGDEADKIELNRIRELYERIGYPVYVTSSKTGAGIADVRARLDGKISVFAGQSGVGKSSLLNALVPGLSLATNEISFKLGRGKHTTRHVELIPLGTGGFVADTPGFSQLDFPRMEPEQLAACFKEMKRYGTGCRFRGCLHVQEPHCLVREAAERGEIAESRYRHYKMFLQEVKENNRRY